MTGLQRPFSRTAAFVLTLIVPLVFCLASQTQAQTYRGFFNRTLPFISFPALQGEIFIRPVLVWVADGEQTIASRGISWNLRDDFGLSASQLFVDSMIRFQVGRFSLRFHNNIRDFSAKKKFRGNPAGDTGEARFDYSGYRVGGDVDLVMLGKSRMGLNVDYELYNPIFTEAIQTDNGGKKITAPGPVTMGVHALIRPVTAVYGISGVLEGRARWPLAGADINDWEISAGLETAETFLGTIALKGGYRNTTVIFRDMQRLDGQEVQTRFKIILDGIFGEIVYYY